MTPTIFGLKKRSLCSFLTNELFQDKKVVIELAEKHFFFHVRGQGWTLDIFHLKQDLQNAFHVI